jgi:hypothetical protein
VPVPDSVNFGGTPNTPSAAMWSVMKYVAVRPTVSAPSTSAPEPLAIVVLPSALMLNGWLDTCGAR